MGILSRNGKATLGVEQFTMTGFMKKRNTKQTSVLMRNWDKRWFALDDTALLYAKTPKEKCPKQAFPVGDILDVRMIDAEPDAQGKGVYEFEVTLPGRTLRLRPKSESQRKHWVMALEKARAALKENNPNRSQDLNDKDVYAHNNYKGERPLREQKRNTASRSQQPAPAAHSNNRTEQDRHQDDIPCDEDWNTWDEDDLYISEDDMPETVSPKRKHVKAQPPEAVSAVRQSRYRSKAQKVVEDWDDTPPQLQGKHAPTKVYNNVLCTSTDEEEDENQKCVPIVQHHQPVAADTNWLEDDWDSSDDEE
mmetsp:Transcript_24152/g.29274  ORF Transcript_24152/g.29274 Transcript_24152/m.29274 type:complete len:307 (-) Transcript_24152:942-1862(-)